MRQFHRNIYILLFDYTSNVQIRLSRKQTLMTHFCNFLHNQKLPDALLYNYLTQSIPSFSQLGSSTLKYCQNVWLKRDLKFIYVLNGNEIMKKYFSERKRTWNIPSLLIHFPREHLTLAWFSQCLLSMVIGYPLKFNKS